MVGDDRLLINVKFDIGHMFFETGFKTFCLPYVAGITIRAN